MNRIRHFRETRGLSQEALAKLCNTTQPTIARLELDDRGLTEKWMRTIAKALNVRPADLLDTVNAAELTDDVQPHSMREMEDILGPISRIGLNAYTVVSDSVAQTGITPGKRIVVDERESAVGSVSAGDTVLLEATTDDGESILILRQYLPPGLVVTNRPGSNVALSLNDTLIRMTIRGVVRLA